MKKLIAKFILGSMLSVMIIGITATLSTTPTFAPAHAEVEAPSMPTIPKPDLLPGPDEEDQQADVQEYFRNEAIPTFISGFLGLIAGFALLALIYSGIRFLTSYGEEEGITEAKRIALWSIAGFGITILAYAIVSIINTLAFPEGQYDAGSQEQVIYDDI